MAMLRLAPAALAVACLCLPVSAVVVEPTCPGGGASCAAVHEEDASLLVLRHQHRDGSQAQVAAPVRHVLCPGSSGAYCSGDQCCPGTTASNGKGFPCPNARRDLEGCGGGHKELVASLLEAMTREEKYGFLRGAGWKNNTWGLNPGYYVGNAALHERFSIPSLNMQDSGNGFRTYDTKIYRQVTSWPAALTISCSWSEADTERYGTAVAKEFRLKGANVILGPCVNIARVPQGGRNVEFLGGESSYLASRLVKPWVRSVQSQKVLSVLKHFINNDQETHRGEMSSVVDNRTLWEVYYPPFEAAFEVGVAAVMCGYNKVNGEYACGNADILQRDLKERMKFEGWVQSDWWALKVFAAPLGVDQEMPGDQTPSNEHYFTDANLGTLTDAKVDAMVRPQLAMMLRHGLLEPEDQVCTPPQCDAMMWDAIATSEEHQALSRELATKAVLLLKNARDVLPLEPAWTRRIAVVGSACNASQDLEALAGRWDLGSYYAVGGSGRVIDPEPVSILAGLVAKCLEHGCEVVSELSDDVSAALRKAEGADAVIMCGATTSSEGRDRDTLSIDQDNFMVQFAATLAGKGVPLISLTLTPGAIVMPWAESTDAIVNLFLAGKHTGSALADVVFGDSNPSAKSPVTFPLTEEDMPQPCEELSCPYSEGVLVGWRGMQDKEVLFPFGHGLSYTTFEHALLDVLTEKSRMPAAAAGCSNAVVCVLARVTNTGRRTGVEVVQLYLGFPKHAGEPEKVLRGFVRSPELKPGASVDVAFPLHKRDLQIFSEEVNGRVMPNGNFEIFVGASSRDIRLSAKFAACGSVPSLEVDQHCL